MNATIGGIVNKFKIKHRRSTLFFEDILANYIDECEKAGYEDEMMDIGRRWGFVGTEALTPDPVKILPTDMVLNLFGKKVWINTGLFDDFHAVREKDVVTIKTRNEFITRLIGENKFALGAANGILNALVKSESICIESVQTKEDCKYVYRITKNPFNVETREKQIYNKLNRLPDVEGISLKDALHRNVLQLQEKNRLYFRGRLILPLENTLFHIISNRGLLMERLPKISYDYFYGILERKCPANQLLSLLKNLLQITGWGIVTIITKGDTKIIVEIQNPPHGLQTEPDNWEFIARTILGYLWVLNRNFKMKDVSHAYKKIVIEYSR